MERVTSARRAVVRALDTFFFAKASARPLAALRIGVAAVLLLQAWLLRSEALEMFAQDGIVQRGLDSYRDARDVPRLGWLVDKLSALGIGEATTIHVVCGAYIASLLFLAVGLFSRPAAVLAWLLHWTLASTGYMTIYGVDAYAHIFLFYLMWVPAGSAWSVDVARGRASAEPTSMARFGLRVMQLHLCISYLASGIEKSAGSQWWNGEVLWRALSLPVYYQRDMSWLSAYPWLLAAGGYVTLVIELGYFVFIWPRRTRRLWIAGIVVLHAGIVVFLGLGVFGAMMCVLTPALFAFSPEPRGRESDLHRSTEPARLT